MHAMSYQLVGLSSSPRGKSEEWTVHQINQSLLKLRVVAACLFSKDKFLYWREWTLSLTSTFNFPWLTKLAECGNFVPEPSRAQKENALVTYLLY